jgi:hypothetical protein
LPNADRHVALAWVEVLSSPPPPPLDHLYLTCKCRVLAYKGMKRWDALPLNFSKKKKILI